MAFWPGFFARLQLLTTKVTPGTGSPEGVVTGAIGDVFLRTDGGAATTLYVKESGSGNTGWAAVGGAAAGTVTKTGSPASGNLAKFSGSATITNADLTGDVTTSGGVAATIAAAAVTLAKMADVVTDRLLGRDTAGTGVPEALTVSGGVEFSGSGGIQRSALTGDVTAPAGSNATTIANDAVTYAKMQNTAAATRLLGRGSAAGAGDPEELTLGAGLSMAGTVLSSTVVGTGGGDVVGPGSSVNNTPVLFDGTTGKLIKAGTLLGVSSYIVCASDESDSDNTLHNDAELLFAIAANEVWLIELVLLFTSGASNVPDMSAAFTLPALATMSPSTWGPTVASTSLITTQWNAATAVASPVGTYGYGVLTSATAAASPIYFHGVVRNGANAGNVQFQWAQGATDATPTVRKKDSWMRYTRIA